MANKHTKEFYTKSCDGLYPCNVRDIKYKDWKTSQMASFTNKYEQSIERGELNVISFNKDPV